MITESDIIELYRKCATTLPKDVKSKLLGFFESENDEKTKNTLSTVLKNIEIAEKESIPICQDTGIPYFFIKIPKNYDKEKLISIIASATEKATEEIPLRPNGVDSITGKKLGNVPVYHFEDSEKFELTLMLKGGGSENISQIYTLPNSDLNAFRNLEGVKKCVLDAVYKAQGKGCPPYAIGVGVGGSIEQVAKISKQQLLRDFSDNQELAEFELDLLESINSLNIGPLGLGGKNTAMSIKVGHGFRHPASFFVGVSFSCWALRRQKIE